MQRLIVAVDAGRDASNFFVTVYRQDGSIRTSDSLSGISATQAVSLSDSGPVHSFVSFNDTTATVTATTGPANGQADVYELQALPDPHLRPSAWYWSPKTRSIGFAAAPHIGGIADCEADVWTRQLFDPRREIACPARCLHLSQPIHYVLTAGGNAFYERRRPEDVTSPNPLPQIEGTTG